MNRSRKLATALALTLLTAGSLTACGNDSSQDSRPAATSAAEGRPTSGIRSQAATAAPRSSAGTSTGSADDSTPEPEVTDRQTEMASPAGEAVAKQHASESPEPSDSCGTDSAQSAVDDNISKVPAAFPDRQDETTAWFASDKSTYDPCAALSWVTLNIRGATASSPATQMLFHYGKYLGTTTSKAIGFTPATTRLSDSSIRVTYTYVEGDESNAEAKGRAISTYTWNESTESIDHAGEWPPGIG
ncbi:LppP/LprE family lipoprotein [Kocuria sp.]|uniref:LppP/LprE family lipoprotein n=1 Tax=Kocuria sp. TaxID=1871328 RepID=UPI0026DB2A66|nr:LppP/LprE family lipoprotein [Kocuria sp.]MDO4918813.1 LppP/LprE family lipoprotein [Kocuria sp.]